MKKKLVIIISSLISLLMAVNVVFLIVVMASGQTLTRNSITIESLSTTREYNGEILTNHEYKITDGDLYKGDEIVATFDGEIKDLGETRNLFKVKILAGNSDVTAEYDIKYVYGTLGITKRNVTVKLKDEEAPYDGTMKFLEQYDITEGSLIEGDYVEIKSSEGLTKIGSLRTSGVAHIYDSNKRDVSNNYSITSLDGTISRTAVDLKITSSSLTKIYDGKELVSAGYEVEGNVISTDELKVTTTGTLTDCGEVKNTFDYSITDKVTGIDVSDCYNITKEEGTLKVSEREITLRSISKSKVYDGQLFGNSANDIELEGILPDDIDITFTLTDYANVLDSKYSFEYKMVDKNNKDVTDNFKVTTSFGDLSISKKSLALTTLSYEKQYDGKELVYDKYEYTKTDLIDGDSVEVTFSGYHPVNVGEYINSATIRVKNKSGVDVTSNYDIKSPTLTEPYGTLKINPIDITIRTASSTKLYDGTALSCEDFYVVEGSLLKGHEARVSTRTTITDEGSKENVLGFSFYSGTDLLPAKVYNVTLVYGVLTVTKKTATLYLAPADIIKLATDETTKYEPTAITGFDEYRDRGYTYEATYRGSVIGKGKAITEIDTIKIFNSFGIEVTDSFQINKYKGIIMIYSDAISVTTPSATKTYDGKALVSTDKSLVTCTDGYEIEFTYTGTQTEAGKSYNYISITKITKGLEVLNINDVRITYTLGELVVNPYEITVYTPSASESIVDYPDGFYSNDVSTNVPLITGDVIEIVSYTEALSVGVYTNTIIIKIKNNGVDVTDNYKITYNYGTLTLTV